MEKRCWCCKTVKPLEAFYRNRGEKDGRCGRCAQCSRDHRKENPERYRKYKHDTHLRSNYGVSPERYQEMLAAAHGQCRICKSAEPGGGKRNFAVDHCHETGVVRGLLCNRCNRALGMFGDSADTLRAAAAYLESPVCG